jgi:tRNA A37 threonylcarbamoyladenosine biosynthesis protein TsaE
MPAAKCPHRIIKKLNANEAIKAQTFSLPRPFEKKQLKLWHPLAL